MSETRTKLTEEEQDRLNILKDEISSVIGHLTRMGVRPANIEIELLWHIKNELKGD